MRVLPCLIALVTLTSVAAAHETRRMTLPDGTGLDYVLVLPEGYDPSQKYEALLAFPGGNQSLSRAQGTVERFWEPEAVKRGVIVVAAAAPSIGRPFFMGESSIALVPDIVATMRSTFPIKDGPIHLGGHSNGGISAFRAAIRYPELFQSMTVIAGVPAEWVDFDRLDRLKGTGMRISMFVGATDFEWREPMTEVRRVMKVLGIEANYVIVPRSGHSLEALSFDRSGPLFDAVVPAPAQQP
jgi:pimeloyl-ACP methyl ester carboxylesterase